MIYLNSRYESADVVYMMDGRSGRTRPTVMRGPLPKPTSRAQMRWGDRMRLDLMAFQSQGSPEMWYAIADQNTEILDPMAIEIGDVVRVL